MLESADEPQLASSWAGFDSAVPVPVEVPVHVRGLVDGARSLGADCPYEPFCEDTLTVVVSKRSAVLRLAATAAPGQTILVSSPRLNRELAARVVRYRSHPDVKGYAEVEFTSPESPRQVELPSPDSLPQGTRAAPPAVHSVLLQPALYAEAAAPPVVTALTEWLTSAATEEHSPGFGQSLEPAALEPVPRDAGRTSVAAVSLAGVLAHDATVPPAPLRPQGKAPCTGKARPLTGCSTPLDLEALLAVRRAAERAQPSLAELAARLLNPSERVLFAKPSRPRKRLATAAAIALLLTLGAAGAWAVVRATVVPELWPFPQIAAFAPPEPPAFVESTRVTIPKLWFEPEPMPLATKLVAPSVMRTAAESRRLAAPNVRPLVIDEVAPPDPATLGMMSSHRGEGAPPITPRPLLAGEGIDPKLPPRPPTGGVTPPRLVFQAPLQYPAFARQSGIEGDVVVDARIDQTGRVTDLRVVSGPAALQQAAKDSLAQWRYQPATLNGQSITTHLYVTIQFRR